EIKHLLLTTIAAVLLVGWSAKPKSAIGRVNY
ncbi:uncharacterized protein METZ01_LOCUS193407, partial [marine metagenome]